jgi:REG-2-like HAD superfamily hydrolase
MGYKGVLGDYYCMAAKRSGLPCPDYERMHQGFKVAYKEMDTMYPCFGKLHNISNQEWWRICVRKAFCEAGYDYTDKEFDAVFKRIYGIFGSAAPYEVFEDAKPFLRWVRTQGIVVGVLSNASYRYRDDILPQLGLRQGEEWDFGVFSGIEGVEKPNPEIFKIALSRAGDNILPEQALHIGDSLRKDFVPAAALGMHALLLNRFDSKEARAAKENGVLVVTDLHQCQDYITSLQEEAKTSVLL